MGNGITESTTFNTRLQRTQIQATALSGPLLTLGYNNGTTNNSGNVRSQTISWPGLSPITQNYQYDGVNRLQLASENPSNQPSPACPDASSSWCQQYGYDNFGNRSISSSSNTGFSTVAPVSFDPATNHNSGTGWIYDSAGNIKADPATTTYQYDAENRQVSAGTSTYAYDGDGRRVVKTTSSGQTTYVYDAAGNLAAEYGTQANQLAGITAYLTADSLGSTRLVTDSNAICKEALDYRPFGEQIPTGGPRTGLTCAGVELGETLKFTGKERDSETGLDYFGARYMSSAEGRFTSPDSSGPELTNPQTLNKYRYALNNPLRYVDRNGLYEEDVHRDLTYSLALAAGINASSASRIASADQGIDENPATSPTQVTGGGLARAMWHFTDPSRRNFLWDTFLDNSNPETLGQFLHPEQDSYSHAGLGPNLGQAVTWPWKMTAVDKTYNDPDKADRMAQDTFGLLVAANPQLGNTYGANYRPLDWKTVSKFVQRFNRARAGDEKKKVLQQLNGLAQRNIEEQKAERQRAGVCSAEFASCP